MQEWIDDEEITAKVHKMMLRFYHYGHLHIGLSIDPDDTPDDSYNVMVYVSSNIEQKHRVEFTGTFKECVRYRDAQVKGLLYIGFEPSERNE